MGIRSEVEIDDTLPKTEAEKVCLRARFGKRLTSAESTKPHACRADAWLGAPRWGWRCGPEVVCKEFLRSALAWERSNGNR